MRSVRTSHRSSQGWRGDGLRAPAHRTREYVLRVSAHDLQCTHHSITCTLFEIELANFMEEKNEDC